DAAIEFYWAPFLVELNNDNPFYHHSIGRIVRVKSIEKHARLWTDAGGDCPFKLLSESFISSDAICKEVEVPRSYEMALLTWPEDWGMSIGDTCYNETEIEMLSDMEEKEILRMARKHSTLMTLGTKKSYYVIIITALLFSLVLLAVYGTGYSRWSLEDMVIKNEKLTDAAGESSPPPECNLFLGKWVFDNQSYPLYKEQECSFKAEDFACGKHGRKDLKYQNWRWQPHHCDLPRFNATALLERLREKRVVYVGDSIIQGQWFSMLMDAVVALKEYNASIEYYWAPLLVESNGDDPTIYSPDRIVRVGAIEKHAKHWTNAHVLIFGSYLWWRLPKMKVLWGSFEESDGIYKDVELPRCYEMALQTWSDWLEVHMNRADTQVFWISMSPTHELGEDWGKSTEETCYNETEPITEEGYQGRGSIPEMMKAVEATISRLKHMGLNVQLLNITQLSEYRKEAHPSFYRKFSPPLTQDQLANPRAYADCFHWCLPGVPDTWNELLYSYIVLPNYGR
ncbi:PC-Esterase, partial [Dillenia turbinata]